MIGNVEAPKIKVTLEMTRAEAKALCHFLTYGSRKEFSISVEEVAEDLLKILKEIQ